MFFRFVLEIVEIDVWWWGMNFVVYNSEGRVRDCGYVCF